MVQLNDDLQERLAAAALRYVTPKSKGYTRKKSGKGFVYLDSKGVKISDKALKAWINTLVIPPAWQNVWIATHKNAHILVTGRDDKGRKQYIYHPLWQQMASEKKFGDLVAFGESLPTLRRALDHDLRQKTLTQRKVVALVVALLGRTLIRIGNQEYARDNETFGLTTLNDDHVEVEGATVRFSFVGKSKKSHEITLKDKRLARVIRACQEIPGFSLFQYYDADGNPHAIDSAHINQYLLDVTGQPFTAKVFRTWGGSVDMIHELCLVDRETIKNHETCIRAGVKAVSKILGNTTSVCRAYYVHPVVLDAFLADTLHGALEAIQTPNDGYALEPEEQLLMTLMRASIAA